MDNLKKNSFELSDDVDPSILVQRDSELELIGKKLNKINLKFSLLQYNLKFSKIFHY